MLRSPTARFVLIALAFISILSVLRLKPWQRFATDNTTVTNSNKSREQLGVGFLPVT